VLRLAVRSTVRQAGASCRAAAAPEPLNPAAGRAEGRVYKRLRVLLRYTACTGLINQQYSHIAAFSLAAVLGAEIVLPPAAKRDSFAHYFSVFKVRRVAPCSIQRLGMRHQFPLGSQWARRAHVSVPLSVVRTPGVMQPAAASLGSEPSMRTCG
jgi:hypothetical protein